MAPGASAQQAEEAIVQERRILQLDGLQETYPLAYEVDYFEDKASAFPEFPGEVPEFLQSFQPFDRERLNFGFSMSDIWLRFTLVNTNPQVNDWLMEIAYPNLDLVEIYEPIANGSFQQKSMGDLVPFYQREILHRNFLVALDLPDNSPRTYYMRVRSEGALQVPITIARQMDYFTANVSVEMAYGMFIGIMAVMLLYNLFIYLSFGEITYLLYVFPILSYACFSLNVSGHIQQYLFPQYPYIVSKIPALAIGTWAFGASLFAKYFLDTKKYVPRLSVALTVMMFAGLVVSLVGFYSFNLSVRLSSLLVIMTSLLLVITGFACWKKGNTAARFFIMAWIFYLLGVILYALRAYTVVPDNLFTQNTLILGSVMEIVILSLALGDKYRLIKKEKEKAQSDMIRMQQEANQELEQKVQERTAEIQKKNADITASINYAQRLQKAALQIDAETMVHVPEHFILYRPKNIVSGDFYQVKHTNGQLFVAAADCTGHGVPGGFMSMLGVNLFNQAIQLKNIYEPDKILTEMHNGVRDMIQKQGSSTNDGMDMSLCRIDYHHNILEYAGARNPLISFDDGGMLLIKGDRLSIGGSSREGERIFTKHTLTIDRPTTVYLLTDGYLDQFGGSERRKFGLERLKGLLGSIQHEPMYRQRELLDKAIEEWMTYTDEKQIDDILVIGIRIFPN
jgi:serine phosphatase RsbU (regulator of sigma subunit)